jgi:GrpB-like predicted nucleotidyltransferase (UPF0157 family)/inhibitor of KinA sporulation pathway (predicted exonuclease)
MDVIKVVDYDAAWPELCAKEQSALKKAFAGRPLHFEHVGSTAVEGLAAKPTLDIMIGEDTLSVHGPETAVMKKLGYDYLGEYGIPGRHFFRKGTPPTHHVHWVRKDADFWIKQVIFRDYLRCHSEESAAYGALKRGLAERFSADRASYTKAKTRFILSLQERAWRWAGAGLIVLDLEATCWEKGQTPERMETIEFGAVKLDSRLKPAGDYAGLVRPKAEPQLSDFCTQLTSIQQGMVDKADPFPRALENFRRWIGPGLWRLASWSAYDLHQLCRDCARNGVLMPAELERHVDLQALHALLRGIPVQTTAEALARENLPAAGPAHRALYDARSVAALGSKLIEELLISPA